MNSISSSSSSRIRPLEEKLAEGLPLDVAILHRFSRRNAMPLDADFPVPYQHGIAGELGSVVADDQTRLATLGDQLG